MYLCICTLVFVYLHFCIWVFVLLYLCIFIFVFCIYTFVFVYVYSLFIFEHLYLTDKSNCYGADPPSWETSFASAHTDKLLTCCPISLFLQKIFISCFSYLSSCMNRIRYPIFWDFSIIWSDCCDLELVICIVEYNQLEEKNALKSTWRCARYTCKTG